MNDLLHNYNDGGFQKPVSISIRHQISPIKSTMYNL